MTKVLFITANPNSAEGSFGMAVGEAFIEAYKNEHPQDEVVTIDLFNTTVPQSMQMYSLLGVNLQQVKALRL